MVIVLMVMLFFVRVYDIIVVRLMYGKINDSFIKFCVWNFCMVRDNDDICLLRFFVGKLIYFMVVYLNVVFSLVVDFNGLYLLFGSKLIFDLVI